METEVEGSWLGDCGRVLGVDGPALLAAATGESSLSIVCMFSVRRLVESIDVDSASRTHLGLSPSQRLTITRRFQSFSAKARRKRCVHSSAPLGDITEPAGLNFVLL